jgi:hypothetical protein
MPLAGGALFAAMLAIDGAIAATVRPKEFRFDR